MVAAVAGVVGAATTRALDTAALLPGVHESADIRGAMSLSQTAAWLALAAGLAWLAARTRPVPVGAASALIVSAVPELVGRHDPGAVVEPGAIAGALVQWLLLLAVIAVVVIADRRLGIVAPSSCADLPWLPAHVRRPRTHTRLVDRRGRPRAPPAAFLSDPVS